MLSFSLALDILQRIERFESKKIMLNVGRAICGIEDGLRALNLLLRIQMEIADGHEQGAVKLIDELQGKGALRAIEEMPFYPHVLATLENAKKSVWDAATGQVKAFLSTVRDQSTVMGSLALSQLQSRFEQFQRLDTNENHPQRHFELFLADLAAEDAEIITSNDLVRIDFGPLQHALRLFSTMDRRGELIELLIETRRVQLDLILGSRVNLEKPDSDVRSVRTFLNALTGFFIFERHLTRLPLALYPLSSMETGWELAQSRIREIALESLRLSASDRGAFMKIKWQLVFFAHALEMFNFPITPLIDTILTLFYRYADLLRIDAQDRCTLAIQNDPLLTNSQNQKLLPQLESPASECICECVNTILTSFLQPFAIFLQGIPGAADRSGDFSDLARKTVDQQILPICAKALNNRLTSLITENANVQGATNSGSSAQLARILLTLDNFKTICGKSGDLTKTLLNFSTLNPNSDNNSIDTGKELSSAQIFRVTLDKSYSTVVNDLLQDDLQEILAKLSYNPSPTNLFNSPSAPIQGRSSQ
jgi:exocyst complex component 6